MVVIRDWFCEENIGFNPRISAGGGAVIIERGGPTTQLTTSNNFYFNSGLSLRGNILNNFIQFKNKKLFRSFHHVFCHFK